MPSEGCTQAGPSPGGDRLAGHPGTLFLPVLSLGAVPCGTEGLTTP